MLFKEGDDMRRQEGGGANGSTGRSGRGNGKVSQTLNFGESTSLRYISRVGSLTFPSNAFQGASQLALPGSISSDAGGGAAARDNGSVWGGGTPTGRSSGGGGGGRATSGRGGGGGAGGGLAVQGRNDSSIPSRRAKTPSQVRAPAFSAMISV